MVPLTPSTLTIQALWQLRGMALLLIGPTAGVILVQWIFGLPTILCWAGAGMSLLMLTIFFSLFLKERALLVSQEKTSCNKQ